MTGERLSGSPTPSGLSFGPGGTVSLVTNGTNQLTGTLGAMSLTPNPVGYTFSAAFKATGGAMASSFKSGGGVFGLLYNVKSTGATGAQSGFTSSAKGDVAALKGTSPIVPEPGTLSLALLGLSGLFAAARRKVG